MSAADMSRENWPMRAYNAEASATAWKWQALICYGLVVVMAVAVVAIAGQRDEAIYRAARVEGALAANDEVRRFADFTTEPGQLFCVDRHDDLVICVKNTKVQP